MAQEWKPLTGLDELVAAKERAQSAKAADVLPRSLPRCTFCGHQVDGAFFQVNTLLACPDCAKAARKKKPADTPQTFKEGLIFGIGAAGASLVVYAILTVVTHLYLGYLAPAIGWLVGKAIVKGSRGAGGRRYQIAAVLLTYGAVSLADVPIVITAFAPASDVDWGGKLGELIIGGIASPLLNLSMGIQGIVGLVVLLAGMRIAWAFTAAKRFTVTGPHTLKR